MLRIWFTELADLAGQILAVEAGVLHVRLAPRTLRNVVAQLRHALRG